tara:strand:- start:7471 stop:7809 length:339 start_codon:yes stop_codon:yes gene_type:complete
MIPDTEPKSPKQQLRRPDIESGGSWSVEIWEEHFAKKGEAMRKKTTTRKKKQGYNARKDESLARRRGSKKKVGQSYKTRRKESAGGEKARKRRKFASVKSMDRKRKTLRRKK